MTSSLIYVKHAMQKALENKIKKMQTTRYVRELTLNYYNHKFSSENLN